MNIRIYRVFLFITFITFIIFGCKEDGNGGFNDDKSSYKINNLKELCNKYASERNSDSLQAVALKLLELSKINSYDYFKANHYYVISLFGKKEYNKAIERINNVTSSKGIKEYKDLISHFNYSKARCYQFSGDYNNAIKEFNNCINDTIDNKYFDSIYNTLSNSLIQIMNSYHSSGRNNECLDYFVSLSKKNNEINKQLERDIKSLLAYSYYKCDSIETAQKIMEDALSLPLYKSSYDRLFRDYSYAAAINYGDLSKQEQVINWCKEAIKAANEYGYNIGSQWTTTLLGNIYYRTGRVNDALELYMESAKISNDSGDKKGEANAYNSLINLYIEWGMFEEANELANISLNNIISSAGNDFHLMGKSLYSKGLSVFKLGLLDSTLYFWEKADKYFTSLPYEEGLIDLDKKYGEILIETNDKNKIEEGIFRLNRSLKSTSWYNRAPAFFSLAKGYINNGNIKLGEAMLDSMSNVISKSQQKLYIGGANEFALEHYLNTNNTNKIIKYSKEYLEENKVSFNDLVTKKVTEAMIKYQTEKKEQQLKITSNELEIKKLVLRTNLYFFISLFILLSLIISWLIYRNKVNVLKQKLLKDNYNQLLEDFKESSNNAKKIEDQLNDILTDKDSRYELKAITPSMFRKNGEAKFRDRFSQLYPSFLLKLKELVPNITRNEEILCMLIILGQSTDQIIDILCIERGSVNMARYRLRGKMKLTKNDSLDEILKSLIDKN